MKQICPACSNLDFEIFCTTKKKDYCLEGFRYLKCKSCSSIFLEATDRCCSQKDLTQFHINNWYNKYNFDFLSHLKQSFNDKLNKGIPKSEKIYNLVKNNLQTNNIKVLDFGCGLGELVVNLNKLGLKTFGYEVTKSILENIPKKYHNKFFIENDLFKTVDNNNTKLKKILNSDFTLLIDVLEHTWDPNDFIKKLKKYLINQNNFIYLEVPVSNDPQFKYLKEYSWTIMAPYHRSIFSLNGIKIFLENHGFKIVKLEKFNLRWGWTRGIAWQSNFSKEHSKNRLKKKEFREFDYMIDKMLNKIHENEFSDVGILAKRI